MTQTRITAADFEEHIGPLGGYSHQCHAASIALVKCDDLWLPGQARRVARGTCPGVGGQHSWVVVGKDAYNPRAQVIDPTLWSYNPKIKGIWHGKANKHPHRPHGDGSIWEWGRPTSTGGEIVEIETASLSAEAVYFLDMVEPLDRRGWMELAGAPVLGWPAAEIIAAMDDTPELAALVPVDRLGMLTNRNPMGLYLPE